MASERDRLYAEGFDNLGVMLQAAAQAEIDGPAAINPKLERGMFDGLAFQAAAGMTEFVPSEGGFVIPEQFAADLWMRAYDAGRLMSLCDRQPITRGNALKIPAVHEDSRANGSRFGGMSMTWLQEGEAATDVQGEMAVADIWRRARCLGLHMPRASCLPMRAALAAWFRRAFAMEAAFSIEDKVVSGDGTIGPLGVLNSKALITVDKASGQADATVVASNFENMMARLWGPSRPNSVWLTSNDVMAQAEGISRDNGDALVEYDGDGSPTILGRPVLQNEYTSTLGAAGDVMLIDPMQYLLAEIAPEFVSSIHVKFVTDEAAFRVRYRVDGQPAWDSALTPKNSTTTQSAFVALGARSA